MSCADAEGCFTFTWEFENFDIFLRAKEGRLLSPAWKTETTEGKEVWWQVLAYQCRSYEVPFTRVDLIRSSKTWKPDICESFVIASCGRISPKCPDWFSISQFADFEICNEDMLGNDMQSNIPRNCLKFECKMWSNSMKTGEFRIHTNVKKVHFCWCLEDPLFFNPNSKPYSHNKIVKKDNMRIIMILESEGVNDKYRICALALPIIIGCFSFVYCNVVCDFEMQESTITNYNDLRTEYREEWIIGIQSGMSCNTSYKVNLQLDTIVAHHSNSRYPITHPTSSAIAKTGGSSEEVNDPVSKSVLVQLFRESHLGDATINTEPLKQKCADIQKAGLTVDNVCDALVSADKQSDEHLMKWAMDFIYDHPEVVLSPKFEKLEDIKPRLTSKVMKDLFLRRGRPLKLK